jgi:16S rRNA (uracil1498-N3)-methyltransferase
MRRALVEDVGSGRVRLSADEAHHLVRVLRLTRGAEFEGVTGDGRRLRCRLDREGEEWYGHVTGSSTFTAESPLHLALAQALIKRDRFEWVVQKAVELGVAEIFPLETARSELRLDEHRRDRKRTRWERIIQEAVKQCGRTRLPVLHEPQPFSGFLAGSWTSGGIALDEEGSGTLGAVFRHPPRPRCTLLIGPEGGWDPQERRLLDAAGIRRVRLGPRVLRTETAAVAGLALIQFTWGDLSRNPEEFRLDYTDV